MFRALRTCLIGFVAGLFMAVAIWTVLRPETSEARIPDPPSLIQTVRDVARLESLDVTLYKKVELDPDPVAEPTLLGELGSWATWTIDPPRGRAIVFAQAHLGLDLSKLDAHALRVRGHDVEITLPPVVSSVELEPSETEVIRSNLDSAQTAALLAKAKDEIASDVAADPKLRDRARLSAQHALAAVLMESGFHHVTFVDGGAAPTS